MQFNGQSKESSGKGSSKNVMQMLYKSQLDNMMVQKEQLRAREKQRVQDERTRFNANVEYGQQAEKMKDISYRNYYAMLMNNQQQHQDAYVNPYTQRETMKDTHINSGLQSEQRRYQAYQIDMKRKEIQRKNAYKNQLLAQINDRRSRDILQKEQYYQLYQDKYHQQSNLEQNKDSRVKYPNGGGPPQVHNTLTNPMPFNIQNPYLLKQMASMQTPLRTEKQSQSYLATQGNRLIN